MDEISNDKKTVYDTLCFAAQLKKIRKYKLYLHQSNVSKEIGFSRQVFSLWELGKRLPTITQIIELANFFQIEMGYFFTPDANPEDFENKFT